MNQTLPPPPLAASAREQAMSPATHSYPASTRAGPLLALLEHAGYFTRIQIVEVCRESEMLLAQAQLTGFGRDRSQRHQARYRLARTRDHDFLARFHLLDDARKLGFG